MKKTGSRRAVLRDIEHVGLRLLRAVRHPSESEELRHPLRSAYNMFALLAASVEGVRDSRRMRRDLPALHALDESLEGAIRELEPTYREYISKVSRWDWAISLELAAVLMACCRLLRPTRMLDTGSGYSSYVLRRYAAESTGDALVVSVDHDLAWLDKTRAYLKAHGLPWSGTLSWDEFQEQDGGGEFDLVVHDLGSEAERARTLAFVLGLMRPGGFILLDDVGNPHMRKYGPYARRMLRAGPFRSYSLRALTREHGYSRYAMLAVRL